MTALAPPTSDPLGLDVRAEAADRSPGADLLAAFVAEVAELYGPMDDPRWPSASPEELAPPEGSFLVLYGEGRPIACGGLKRLGPGVGEIKRMYVVPDARGRGVARRLLADLEAAARHQLGYDRVRLDTGARQPHARALYESAGYRQIPDYNGNPYASYWYEKDLS